MVDKIKSLWDWCMVGVIYLLLRLRWAYFHISPSYIKFYMTDTEAHFQHKRDGSLHSDIKMHLTNGRVL